MGANIFQNAAKSIPESDEQIVRVPLDQADIGGRKSHMPAQQKSPADVEFEQSCALKRKTDPSACSDSSRLGIRKKWAGGLDSDRAAPDRNSGRAAHRTRGDAPDRR